MEIPRSGHSSLRRSLAAAAEGGQRGARWGGGGACAAVLLTTLVPACAAVLLTALVPACAAVLLTALVPACAAAAPSSAAAPSPPAAPWAQEAPVPLAPDALRWVEETLASLDLREKAGQLVSVWMLGGYASTSSEEHLRLLRLVEEGIGGVIVSAGLPHSYGDRLNGLQGQARVPLLVSSDFESGGPGFRLGGVYALPHVLDMGGGTDFPPTMAFGAIGEEGLAYELGRVTGVEARAVGVHLTLAPVLDVNSNPENPIINTRSFGEDPEAVARLGAAFIRGARAAGLLTAAKHFPGHGDTRVDSHLELPAVSADRARLEAVELVPFRRAIREGVDAVLVAHIAVPAVEGPDAPPASLSRYFVTELLRGELGFRGLVITEAMDMAAIAGAHGPREAAVRALEAGADVVLMPPDPTAVIDALAQAVRGGRIPEARLDSSVRRVLEAKARAGLHRSRRVELERVSEVVGSRVHRELAERTASRSITLARDRAGRIPLDPSLVRRVLSLTYGRREDLPAGRAFDRTLRGAVRRLEAARLDEWTPPSVYDSLLLRAEAADLVLLSLYVPPQEGVGSVDVPDALVRLAERLEAAGRPPVLLSFGSPYLLSRFPGTGTYLLAWGGREVSQRAAARAVLGRAPISGRLPVSLPPHHRRGEGLDRPARGSGARPPDEGTDASAGRRPAGPFSGRQAALDPRRTMRPAGDG